jgi:uncharacterized protein
VSEASGTGSELDRLWAVQQWDSRLADAKARRAALDDGAALRAELEAARATSAEVAARLRQAQATLRTEELHLEGTESKKRKAEEDLYGGRIGNPKELTSLQEEIAALARGRDQLEDHILTLLDQVEALRQEDAERKADVRALEQRLAAHQAEFATSRDRLDAEISTVAAERAALASVLEPRLLKKYESIAAQEGGVGMVAVLSGWCGGCRNNVPPHFLSRIREGQVVTCERCHRILYLVGLSS